MRALLRIMPDGVPDDCLLARLKGRRAFLVSDWDRLEQLPEPLDGLTAAPWRAGVPLRGEGWEHRALQQEYARVFGWLREPLRRLLAPFFWLAEVRTMGICLRTRAGGGTINQDMLRFSLLCDPMRRLFGAPAGMAETVAHMAEILVSREPAWAVLPDVYRTNGAGALETALNSISLQRRRIPDHPVVRQGIALAIDGVNLTSLAKALRWKLATPPRLLPGGTLRPSTLNALAERGDRAGLARMAAGLGGHGQEGAPDDLERTVARAQQRALLRLARDPSGIGVIISYLWRCRLEASAIGLLARIRIAGVESVAAEIGQ